MLTWITKGIGTRKTVHGDVADVGNYIVDTETMPIDQQTANPAYGARQGYGDRYCSPSESTHWPIGLGNIETCPDRRY